MAIILILFGITIICFSLYSLVKENYKPKENSFKTIFKDSSDSLTDTQLLVGQMRREFAETILELQREIVSLRGGTLSEDEDIVEVETEVFPENEADEAQSVDNSTLNSIRINDIERLLSQGHSVEEISEQLEVTKGEILLIKNLYLK